ncbi:MAG: hypothetical protein JO307_02270 [Bryobacterales bacterium]|nr:hypothetical protein [Bryobacterales bacterium]MBV9398964.1 hypothetical protein [Bryobacterales bacterium]
MTAAIGNASLRKSASGKARQLWNRVDGLWFELARRQRLAVFVLGALPLLIRVSVLHWYPIPQPKVADEFSHLLIADTFASGRIVNPTHPFWRHFETLYEFQRPVYASIYTPGQGLVLAAGQVIAGHPWWGVWASCGLMCAAIGWMLFAWVSPGWALLGGLLSATQLGITSYWMNSYWGGSMTAFGGALALGALPRLLNSRRPALAFAFALGLAIVFSIRPYEGALFACALGIILVVGLMRGLLRARAQGSGWPGLVRGTFPVMLPITAVILIALAAFAYYNFRVTGSPWLMPYQLSQTMYGVPRGLTFQAPPPQPPGLTQDQLAVYRWQARSQVRNGTKWRAFASFYLGGPLIAALCFLPLAWREPRMYLLAAVCIFVGFGASLYWYYVNHYLAPLTGVVFGLVVLGLRQLWNWRVLPSLVRHSAVVTLLLLHLVINFRDKFIVKPVEVLGSRVERYAVSRAKFESQLTNAPGRHLVFVRANPGHPYDAGWIYNRADIDKAKVVWAREIDPQEDVRLIRYFAGRTVWLLEVDAKPIRLTKLSTMPPG